MTDQRTVVGRDDDERRDALARSIRVYVAAAATETARVAAAIQLLREAGHVVTCTWPEVVAATPGGSNPRDASRHDRHGWSRQDLHEVCGAGVLWMLVPTLPAVTRGAWFEAGFAHACGKTLVFSGDTKQSVFCALGEEFADDMDAFKYITGLAL